MAGDDGQTPGDAAQHIFDYLTGAPPPVDPDPGPPEASPPAPAATPAPPSPPVPPPDVPPPSWQAEGKPPPPAQGVEGSRDVIAALAGLGGADAPPLPPGIDDLVTVEPPDDVVPVAGDSAPDQVDDFGDGHYHPPADSPADSPAEPPAGPPAEPPAVEGPAGPPFGGLAVAQWPDDDDDDDDDGEPTETSHALLWLLGAGSLVTVGGIVLGVALTHGGPDTSGTSTTSTAQTSVSGQPSAQSSAQPSVGSPADVTCTPPAVPASLNINWGQALLARECVGPGQYPSDPRNKAYAYFAWETMVNGHEVQLVVTSAPLTHPVTDMVTPDTQTALRTGARAAQVDLYDNGSGTTHLAKSGSVVLNPNGMARFVQVRVTFFGQTYTLNGTLPAD